MPLFLLVLEAHSRATQYEPLLDVMQRIWSAQRLLRTAWLIEATSPSVIHQSIRMYLPVNDGLLIVPWEEPRVERNLRTPTTQA
jgi:hypothetical protein